MCTSTYLSKSEWKHSRLYYMWPALLHIPEVVQLVSDWSGCSVHTQHFKGSSTYHTLIVRNKTNMQSMLMIEILGCDHQEILFTEIALEIFSKNFHFPKQCIVQGCWGLQFSSNAAAEILVLFTAKQTHAAKPHKNETLNFWLWLYQPMTANKFFVMCTYSVHVTDCVTFKY